MADSFRFYHDWMKQAERLSDSERGRLLSGIAEFCATGNLPEFRGNERFVFPLLSPPPDAPDKAAQPTPAPSPTPATPKKRKTKPFVPPTLDEVTAFIQEKGYPIDARKFMDYFQESGWIDSLGKPVLNWKQKIITWGSRGGNKRKERPQIEQHNQTDADLSHLLVDLDKEIDE